MRLSITQGMVSVEPMLNKLASEIRPWTVEEFLENYWSGVEFGEGAWPKTI